MDNQKKIDDVLSMIEGFMSKGGGHMNVEVNPNEDSKEDVLEKHVVTMGSNECAGQNMACKVPTLHEGLDREE